MREGGVEALGLEIVVDEGVAARIGGELGAGQPRIGEPAVLAEARQLERDAVIGAELPGTLQEDVGEADCLVVAVALRAVVVDVEQHAPAEHLAADLPVEHQLVAVARRDRAARGEFGRHVGGDVVDDTADGLRAEADLPCALQHLDPGETLDRRVVIGCVVAIGCEAQRDAVLEQQHLGRAHRVEAADADVGPRPRAFLVAREDACDLPQRVVDVEHAAAAQVLP